MGKRRLWVLVALLLGITTVWGVAFAQNWLLERELAAIAKGLEAENQDRVADINHRPVDVVSVITAARDHIVYGQVIGKIAVYTSFAHAPGHYTYSGVEYHYLKNEAAWTMTDSGACTAGDCLEAARHAFGHDDTTE